MCGVRYRSSFIFWRVAIQLSWRHLLKTVFSLVNFLGTLIKNRLIISRRTSFCDLCSSDPYNCTVPVLNRVNDYSLMFSLFLLNFHLFIFNVLERQRMCVCVRERENQKQREIDLPSNDSL